MLENYLKQLGKRLELPMKKYLSRVNLLQEQLRR